MRMVFSIRMMHDAWCTSAFFQILNILKSWQYSYKEYFLGVRRKSTFFFFFLKYRNLRNVYVQRLL